MGLILRAWESAFSQRRSSLRNARPRQALCQTGNPSPCGWKGYAHELVALPGWPQYCVIPSVLHCLVGDAPAVAWMLRREKNWRIYHDFASGGRDDRPGLDNCSGGLGWATCA